MAEPRRDLVEEEFSSSLYTGSEKSWEGNKGDHNQPCTTMKPARGKLMQGRCHVGRWLAFYSYVRDHMTPRHISLLRRAPFFHLFDIPEIKQQMMIIDPVVSNYDPISKTFKIGTKQVQFRASDVAVLLGLPLKGKTVVMQTKHKHHLYQKHFLDKGGSLSRRDFEAVLESLVRRKDAQSEIEFAQLLLVFFCGTVLFPLGNTMVPLWLFSVTTDLESLHVYSWSDAVHTFLMRSIHKAMDKVAKRKGGDHNTNIYLDGCLILLSIWLYEITGIVKCTVEGVFPRIMKWETRRQLKLHSLFREISALPPAQIANELTNYNDAEKELLAVEAYMGPTRFPKKCYEHRIKKMRGASSSAVKAGPKSKGKKARLNDDQGESQAAVLRRIEARHKMEMEALEGRLTMQWDTERNRLQEELQMLREHMQLGDIQLTPNVVDSAHVDLGPDSTPNVIDKEGFGGDEQMNQPQAKTLIKEDIQLTRSNQPVSVPFRIGRVKERTYMNTRAASRKLRELQAKSERVQKRGKDTKGKMIGTQGTATLEFSAAEPLKLVLRQLRVTPRRKRQLTRKRDENVASDTIACDDFPTPPAKPTAAVSSKYVGREHLEDWEREEIDNFLKLNMDGTLVWRFGEYYNLTRRQVYQVVSRDYLEDDVIDAAAMQLLHDIASSPSDHHSCYFFRSLFHNYICLNNKEGLYREQERFARKFDNGCRYIFIPMCSSSTIQEAKESFPNTVGHWHLLVIDLEEKIFRHLNSINVPRYRATARELAASLKLMFSFHHTMTDIEEWDLLHEKCPQQWNGVDCGMYIIMYMQQLVRKQTLQIQEKDIPVHRLRFAARMLAQGRQLQSHRSATRKEAAMRDVGSKVDTIQLHEGGVESAGFVEKAGQENDTMDPEKNMKPERAQ